MQGDLGDRYRLTLIGIRYIMNTHSYPVVRGVICPGSNLNADHTVGSGHYVLTVDDGAAAVMLVVLKDAHHPGILVRSRLAATKDSRLDGLTAAWESEAISSSVR